MNIRKIIILLLIAAMLAVLASCGEYFAPPKSTEELNGTSSDSGYTNDYLGLSMSYPEGYTVLPKEKIQELFKNNIDAFKTQFKDPAKAEEAVQNSIPIAMAFKHELGYAEGFNASLNIIIQKVNNGLTKDIVSFTSNVVKSTESQATSLKYGEVKSIKLDGKDAAVVDLSLTQSDTTIPEKQYYIASKDYIVIISIAAMEQNEMDEMSQAIEGMKFTGK